MIGVDGIFVLMAILSFTAFLLVYFFIKEPEIRKEKTKTSAGEFFKILKDVHLFRMNFGIFVLHATQISMFMIVPIYLVNQGEINLGDHWQIYLPVLFFSFLLIIPIIIFSEKFNKIKTAFLSSIIILFLAQLVFIIFGDTLFGIILALLIYFVGFNFLEASLPSLVSKIAPINKKGLALGVYNTSQSLGIFVGGALGGLITKAYGYNASFVFCIALIFLWFVLSLGMQVANFKKAN
jgi:predicted MFS family arabinose efflux permease